MSMMIFEVYDALKSAGVSEEKSSAAAKAISGELVTKEHLDARLKATEADIIKWVAALLVAQAGVIVALIKVFA